MPPAKGLSPLKVKLLAIACVGLIVVVGVLGLTALAVGGNGIRFTSVASLPTGLFVCTLIIGMLTTACSVMAVLGLYFDVKVIKESTKATLFNGSLALCALGMLGFFVVGFVGIEPERPYVASQLLEERWLSTPASAHEGVQRAFGCCGLFSADEFYGPNWNTTCAAGQLKKSVCCQGMRVRNATMLTGSCEINQKRYACCMATTSLWPCYRLQPCYEGVMAWFNTHSKRTTAFAFVAGSIGLISLSTAFLASSFLADHQARKAAPYDNMVEEEEYAI